MASSTYLGSVTQGWYHRCRSFSYSPEYLISRYLVTACLTSFKKSPFGHQIFLICRAAWVSSRVFPPANSPVEQGGDVGQKLSGLVLGVSDEFGAFIIPHTTTSQQRGLNEFARKHSKWAITGVSEEGEEENVFAEHTAYKAKSVPSSRLRPAEEGLKQLSECRNQAKREHYMCPECFCGRRTVYNIMCLHLWVGVVLPAVQCFLRSC